MSLQWMSLQLMSLQWMSLQRMSLQWMSLPRMSRAMAVTAMDVSGMHVTGYGKLQWSGCAIVALGCSWLLLGSLLANRSGQWGGCIHVDHVAVLCRCACSSIWHFAKLAACTRVAVAASLLVNAVARVVPLSFPTVRACKLHGNDCTTVSMTFFFHDFEPFLAGTFHFPLNDFKCAS